MSGPVRQRNHYFKSRWDGLVNSTRWNDVAWKARSPVSGRAISGQQWVSQINGAGLGEQAREVAATEVSGRGIPQQGVAATATKSFPGKEPEHFVAQVRLGEQNGAAHGDTILIEPKRNFARTVAISKELIGVKLVVAQILIELFRADRACPTSSPCSRSRPWSGRTPNRCWWPP